MSGNEIKAWASFFRDGSIFLVAPSWKTKAQSKKWLDAKHWESLRISRVAIRAIRAIKPTPKKSKRKSQEPPE